MAMIASFDIPLVYAVRVRKRMESHVSQSALSPAAYPTIVVVRSAIFGCILAFGWMGTFLPYSSDQLVVNADPAIFATAWTFTCTLVIHTVPSAFASHAVVLLNVFTLLF